MKLRTLIENLKFYKSKGSKQVTLDIDELLTAVSEVSEIKEIQPKRKATKPKVDKTVAKRRQPNPKIINAPSTNKQGPG